MKTIKLISMSLLLGLFLIPTTNLYAQDPVVVAPSVYKKILIDNNKVRVIEIEIAAGQIVPWHSHPNHVGYALTDVKLEITEKGKDPVVADLKAGDAMYIPAVTHMGKNIGTMPAKLVITEIKPMMHKKTKTTTVKKVGTTTK